MTVDEALAEVEAQNPRWQVVAMSSDTVRAGDLFYWRPDPDSYPIGIEVLRVLRGGKAAEVRCVEPTTLAVWTKRQPLPFPDTFIADANNATQPEAHR